MKQNHPAFPSSAVVAMTLAAWLLASVVSPQPALAGPDAVGTTARKQRTRVTAETSTFVREDAPPGRRQPLREREKHFKRRGIYKALTLLELTGTEFDDPEPGYLRTTGPVAMRLYRAPLAPRPRQFHESTAVEEKPATVPAGPVSPVAPLPDASPAASPAPAVPPVAPPAPDENVPGLLPDAAPNASSQSRTDEILSYFQRQNAAQRPGNPAARPFPEQSAGYGFDPSFLQPPTPTAEIPPSRATYRVTPE